MSHAHELVLYPPQSLLRFVLATLNALPRIRARVPRCVLGFVFVGLIGLVSPPFRRGSRQCLCSYWQDRWPPPPCLDSRHARVLISQLIGSVVLSVRSRRTVPSSRSRQCTRLLSRRLLPGVRTVAGTAGVTPRHPAAPLSRDRTRACYHTALAIYRTRLPLLPARAVPLAAKATGCGRPPGCREYAELAATTARRAALADRSVWARMHVA